MSHDVRGFGLGCGHQVENITEVQRRGATYLHRHSIFAWP